MHKKNKGKEIKHSSIFYPKGLTVIITLFLISTTILVYLYCLSQKNALKVEIYNDLTIISDLKANNINNWIRERKNDADLIVNEKFIKDAIYQYVNNPNDRIKEDLLNIFRSLIGKGFFTIRLINTDFENLISLPEDTRELGGFVKNEIKDIINSKIAKIYLTDIRHYENSDSLHIDIIAPIFNKAGEKPFAVLIFEINPEDFLFNYINTLHVEGESFENLLIERFGNEVVNINRVKHLKSNPLMLRNSLDEENNISVKAIKGEKGIIEGIDYRGVNVIAASNPIEETNWILISKIDEDEIYKSLSKLTTWFIIFLGSTIFIIIFLIILIFVKTKYQHKIDSSKIQEKKDALQKHYETIIRYANDIFILTSQEGDIIYVNDKALETYGYTKEEIMKMNIKNLRAPNYRKEIETLLKQMKEEKRKVIETYHIKKDGTIFPVEASIRRIEIGDKLYIQSIIRDISERKNAEKKIYHLNRTYALLSKINETIVRTKDKKTLFYEICNIACKVGEYKVAFIGLFDKTKGIICITSYSCNSNNALEKLENLICGDSEICSPEMQAIKENQIILCNQIKEERNYKKWAEIVLKSGLNSSISLPIVCKDKVIGVLSLYSEEPDYFFDDEIKLLKEIASDISYAVNTIESETEREKVFKDLENSEHKFKMLFHKASDAMLLLDFDKIIDCNNKALEMFSMNKEDLLGKKPYELSPEKQKDGTNSKEKALQFIKLAINGQPQNFEWIHIRENGSILETEISLNKIVTDNNELILVIIRDITKRKKFEEELLLAKQKAEEMNRLKSNFLANMSHELRTPMTGIIGFAEVLYNSISDNKQKELVEIILKSSKRLTDTLNLILDLSKIEADKVELKLEPIKISSIILDTALLFQISATRKNLNLKTEIKDDVYASLDKIILEKILSNLVKNAIAYTKKGEIVLSVERENTLKGNYAVIKVKDTGIGIPKDKLGTVFEPFRQVSEGYDRFFEGTGLGLTITKKYTELMGGEISLNSEVGVGSIFTIKFPELNLSSKTDEKTSIKKECTSNIKPDKIKSTQLKKVLLVEDDEENELTIKYILKDICALDTVANGYDAISSAIKENYQLILMDIGLKGIDGVKTTQEIRKIEKYSNIPIIAITAFAMVGDKEKFIEAGCSHYLSKPFSTNELRELVFKLLYE